jgi:hypothetical protein
MVGNRYRDPRTVPLSLLNVRPEGPSHDAVGMPTPDSQCDDDRITGFVESVAPKLTPPLLSACLLNIVTLRHSSKRKLQYCV